MWGKVAYAAGALVVCGGALAGCGTSGRADAATEAADAFLNALSQGDGAAACAVLAPDTANALAASEGTTCEEAAAALDLPTAAVEQMDVWSDRAQARTGADVLFLAEFEDGWKVVAAGCRPQGDKPYECEVSA